MSSGLKTGWVESLPVRLLVLVPLAAGAYLIVLRLPALIDPTPLTDFPIVTTVLALLAYLTVLHVALDALSSIVGWITRPKSGPRQK
jgi:hypothetical protein